MGDLNEPNVTLHFDGAVEPVNPGGTGSWGYILTGLPLGEVKGWGAIPAAPAVTNNIAEWTALLEGLTRLQLWAADASVKGGRLTIRGDSQLVINQLVGKWVCRAAGLIPLRDRCRAILRELDWQVEAGWVPRELNSAADALTQRAYEEATGKKAPVRPR